MPTEIKSKEELEVVYMEETLQKVMAYYAGGVKNFTVYRFEFYINPIDNKVIFKLVGRKK